MAYTVITIIIFIASILLVGVVLVQNSKGGGLSSGFTSQNQLMGVKRTTDFIEKATWTLVGIVIVFSIFSVTVNPHHKGGARATSDVNTKELPQQAPPQSPVPPPQFPMPSQE
jgi:preprotein translocase subunit SecG